MTGVPFLLVCFLIPKYVNILIHDFTHYIRADFRVPLNLGFLSWVCRDVSPGSS